MAIGAGLGMFAGSLFSGIFANNSANKQAAAQREAARMQTEENKRQFDMVWGAGANQRRVGDQAMNALNAYQGPNMDASDPSYQFRLEQGNKALENYLSGNSRLSGGAQRAVSDYNQGMASTEYQNAYNRDVNRLSTLAGFGPTGVTSGANASSNYLQGVSNIAQNVVGAGNADASRYSAFNNAVQGGLSNYLSYKSQQFKDTLNNQYQFQNSLGPNSNINAFDWGGVQA